MVDHNNITQYSVIYILQGRYMATGSTLLVNRFDGKVRWRKMPLNTNQTSELGNVKDPCL